MALITCPKCGKQFSDHAQACPQCGTSKEEVERLIKEQKAKDRAVLKRMLIACGIVTLFIIMSFGGYVAYINLSPIKVKNKQELEAALQHPLRFSNEMCKVAIPNSVTNIGNDAFYGCSSLASVTIPNSVTSIGEGAFCYCISLTSVTIPNSVTSIGDDVFSVSSSLTSVTIPNSVTSIGSSAFAGCTGLTSIIVESGNAVYDSRNNCNAIIETANNDLIAGCQNTIIPNSVTSIGDWAFFRCSSLTSVTIPNSVTSIGDHTFEECTNLRIKLPQRFYGKVNVSDCWSVTYY